MTGESIDVTHVGQSPRAPGNWEKMENKLRSANGKYMAQGETVGIIIQHFGVQYSNL